MQQILSAGSQPTGYLSRSLIELKENPALSVILSLEKAGFEGFAVKRRPG